MGNRELRKIDKIVFNQDKTHYAVLWAEGGFSKFDVSSCSLIQTVTHLPWQVEDPYEHLDFEVNQTRTNPYLHAKMAKPKLGQLLKG